MRQVISVETMYSAPVFIAFLTLWLAIPLANVSWFTCMETLASGMASHKVKNAMNTGAEYIVSTDMTCLMHQKAYIEQEGLPIKVIHIAEVLASGWN